MKKYKQKTESFTHSSPNDKNAQIPNCIIPCIIPSALKLPWALAVRAQMTRPTKTKQTKTTIFPKNGFRENLYASFMKNFFMLPIYAYIIPHFLSQ